MVDFESFLDPNFIIQGFENLRFFTIFLPPFGIIFFLSLGAIITSLLLRGANGSTKLRKIVLVIGPVLLFLNLAFWPVLSYLGPIEVYRQTNSYINKHRNGLSELFTKDFDGFLLCVQQKDKNVCKYETNQKLLDRISRDNTLDKFSSTYFVRISPAGEIQKLYIGGDLETKAAVTKNEKKIVKFVKSNSSFFLYAFIDQAYMPFYLNNWGEGEIFVPVKVDGKTVGVIVRIYSS